MIIGTSQYGYTHKAKSYNGEWVTGYYVKAIDECENEVHVIFEPTTIFHNDGSNDGYVVINPSTLCRCLDLKDGHDNFIWEHDIVEIPRFEDGKFVIKWDNEDGKWIMINDEDRIIVDFDNYDSGCVFVIGNEIDTLELSNDEQREI